MSRSETEAVNESRERIDSPLLVTQSEIMGQIDSDASRGSVDDVFRVRVRVIHRPRDRETGNVLFAIITGPIARARARARRRR